MRALGLVLVVLGVVVLLVGGVSFTRHKTVLDAGPLEIQTTHRERLPMPAVWGVASLVVGVGLVFASSRRR